jgi:predicted nucleic-acid-binding protein
MQSLDTNIILRLLLTDVPEQTAVVRDLLAASSAASLVVADGVFFEVVWVLSGPGYNLSRETIGKALLKIADIAQIKCDRLLLAKAIPLYIKHPKLSFIDICLTIYAEFNDAAPLLTFDQQLDKQFPSARLLTQDHRITRTSPIQLHP